MLLLLLRKNLLQNIYKVAGSARNHAHFLQTQSLKSNTNNSNSTNQHSPIVSYLVNSHGLSLDSAISASKKIHNIGSTDNVESVVHFFKTHGFNETDITTFITKYPRIFLYDSNKTLKPKFDFYESLGLSRPNLVKLILANSNLLTSSLENRIIPTLNFVKKFLHTNENLVTALKQTGRRSIFSNYFQVCLEPNISALKDHGVPDYNISKFLLSQLETVTWRNDLFKEAIGMVEEMGFDPKRYGFLLAIRSVLLMSKSTWEKKVDILMSFGWSKEDTLLAFKVQPMYMVTSEKKMMVILDFFLNKLGLKPSHLVKCPNMFMASLEKRIIPRCSVLQLLLSKGLIEKDFGITWVLNSSKKDFEKRFVTKYLEISPEVVNAYKGEMGCPSLETFRSLC